MPETRQHSTAEQQMAALRRLDRLPDGPRRRPTGILPRLSFDAIIPRLRGWPAIGLSPRLSALRRSGRRPVRPPLARANPREGAGALRKYELMFVMQPTLEEEALAASVERLQQVITGHGGQIVKAERLGLHKLAYPIDRHQQGHYVLMQAELGQEAMVELERALKLAEGMLRYLLTRVEDAEKQPTADAASAPPPA
jgi:small subunit ribosomal protein S6